MSSKPHEPGRVELVEVSLDDGDARRMLQQLDAELARVYPEVEDHAEVLRAATRFEGTLLLARLDGEPVGCGGLAERTPETCEIRRMYVSPEARGRGLGVAILRWLEREARAAGYRVVCLETGTRQPRAIRLYEAAGYRRIPPFGEHVDDPYSVCFEKALD